MFFCLPGSNVVWTVNRRKWIEEEAEPMSLYVCFSFELCQVSGAMVINVSMDGYGQANSSVKLSFLSDGYQVWTDQQDQEFGVSTSFALLTPHELNHEVCCITR